jgi:hypothetical protein
MLTAMRPDLLTPAGKQTLGHQRTVLIVGTDKLHAGYTYDKKQIASKECTICTNHGLQDAASQAMSSNAGLTGKAKVAQSEPAC